jgi:hypothetical protein
MQSLDEFPATAVRAQRGKYKMKLLQWLLGIGLISIGMIVTGLQNRDGLLIAGSVIFGSVLIGIVLLISEAERK